MRDVHPVRALYYPNIQFASAEYLRVALLYWEGVVRIVPEGFTPWDPPDVHELVDAGFIGDISPTPYLETTRAVFTERLNRGLPDNAQGAECLIRDSRALIHVSAIHPGLVEELYGRELAVAAGDWVAMSHPAASLYKIVLANQVGVELNAPPMTDEPSCDVAEQFFAFRSLSRTRKASAPVDGFAFARALDPFPAIEEYPPDLALLTRIRDKLTDDRRAFRESVQGRLSSIVDLPSVEAIRAHLIDYAAEIRAQVISRRRTLRLSDIKDIWAALGISAPASIGAAITLAGASPVAAAVGVASSFGLGATDWYLHRRQSRRTGTNYLLSLESAARKRNGLRLAQWVDRLLKRERTAA
jgi:hypothetical protein